VESGLEEMRCSNRYHYLVRLTHLKAIVVKSWGILVFGSHAEIEHDLDSFIRTLCQTAEDKGMRITQRDPTKVFTNSNMGYEEITKRLKEEFMPTFNRPSKIELLVIVTPGSSSNVYVPVKRYCDSEEGIASQCVAKFNVRRRSRDRAFAANVLMKINAKLGGINVTLSEMPDLFKHGTVWP
jgi:hypothetical protein